jgi:hypothetical protein
MKRILLLSFLLIATNFSQTLLLEENFDYTTGTLTSVTTNWTESPIGSVDIQVTSGSLSYTNYPSSGVGNKIVLDGGASGRSGVIRSFATQSTAGSTVYFSFLLNVISTINMDLNNSTGDYFFDFQNSGLSALRGNIYVRQGTNSAKYNIGLVKSSSASLTWYSNELDMGSTYLVVVAYSFISGSDNDAVKLWVNPDLSGTEPSADVNITSGADATDLGYVQFRQRQFSGDMDVDGLRLADSWNLAPLPVELSSFSANVLENSVKLNWRTETEVSNYGFEILRQAQDDNWQVLGFVKGHGNSNSPKDYFFIDDLTLTPNLTHTLYYRLKQIDTDGKFEYSKVVEVDLGSPAKFGLSQNYPNPFNPVTTIKYVVPESGKIRLAVFNPLGEEVATLVDEFKEAGVHRVNFNASGLNSGVYVYQLSAGNFSQIRKMILVK